MAKFDNEKVKHWGELAEKWLNEKHGISCVDIKMGVEAWVIAHRTGISSDAYKDDTVTDAHIKTALQKIFPNAVFKDKYHY